MFSLVENATRLCHSDGNWDSYTNYDRCSHLPPVTPLAEFEPNVELPTIIYYTGYTISLISLTLAVAVFVHFKWVPFASSPQSVSPSFLPSGGGHGSGLWFFRFYSERLFSLRWFRRDLRCLRNTIHANLFVTYIMTALFWILTLSFQVRLLPIFMYVYITESIVGDTTIASVVKNINILRQNK